MKFRILRLFLVTSVVLLAACSEGNQPATAKEPDTALKTAETSGGGDQKTDVTWYTDWTKGMEAAKKEGKPVYVHFTADWCVWCKRMEQDTYSVDTIKKRMANDWITIKIDTEDKNGSGSLFLDRTKQEAYAFFPGETPANIEEQKLSNGELVGFLGGSLPTLLFIDKNGKLIYPNQGYVQKEDFGPMLDYFRDTVYLKNVKLTDYIKNNS